MPGDPNVYALGIEFKLGATQTMKTLGDIEQKLANINKVVANAFKLNIDADNAKKATQQIDELRNRQEKLAVDARGDIRTLQELSEHYDKQTLSSSGLSRAYREMNQAYIDISKNAEKYAEELKDSPELLQELHKELNKLEGAYGGLSKRTKRVEEDTKLFTTAISSTTGISEGMIKNISILADAFGLIPESVKDSFAPLFDYTNALQNVGKGGVDTSKITNGISAASKAMNASSNVSNSLGESMVGAANQAIGGHNKLANAIKLTSDANSAFGSGVSATSNTVGGMSKALGASSTATNALGSQAATAAKGISGAMGGATGAAQGLAGAMGGAGAGAGAAAAGAAAAVPHVAVLMAAMEVANKAAAAFAGTLDALGASGSDAGKALVEAVKSGNLFGAMWAFVKAALFAVIDAQEEFRTTTYRSYGSINDCAMAAMELREEFGLLAGEANETIKAMVKSGAMLVMNKKEFGETAKSVAKFSVATGVSTDTTAKLAVKIKAVTGDADASTRVLAKFSKGIRAMGMSAEEAAGMMEHLAEVTVKINYLMGKNKAEEYGDTLIALTAQFKEFGGGQKEVQELLDAVTDDFSTLSIMSGLTGSGITDMNKRVQMGIDTSYGFLEGLTDTDQMMKQLMTSIPNISTELAAQIVRFKEEGKTVEDVVKAFQNKIDKQKADEELNKSYQESISTIKQEFMRLLIPLMAIIAEAMPPFIEFMKDIIDFAKPIIGAIGKVIEFLNSIYAIKAVLIGFGALIAIIGAAIAVAMIPAILVFSTIMGVIIATGYVLYGLYKLFAWVIGGIIYWAGKAWDALFGSGLFGLDTAIAALKAPFTFLIGLFEKVLGIIKKVADVAKKPFTAMKEGAKGAIGGVLNIVEKVPLIGKAASWVKGKLFGSGLFGIDEGAAATMKPLAAMKGSLAGIGTTAESQMSKVNKVFDSIPDKVEAAEKKALAAVTPVLDPLGVETILSGGVSPVLDTGARATVRPVATAIDQEMGRETHGEKELREMKESFVKSMEPIKAIVELLVNNKDAKLILSVLERYLPKMAEPPSELGPTVSMW